MIKGRKRPSSSLSDLSGSSLYRPTPGINAEALLPPVSTRLREKLESVVSDFWNVWCRAGSTTICPSLSEDSIYPGRLRSLLQYHAIQRGRQPRKSTWNSICFSSFQKYRSVALWQNKNNWYHTISILLWNSSNHDRKEKKSMNIMNLKIRLPSKQIIRVGSAVFSFIKISLSLEV